MTVVKRFPRKRGTPAVRPMCVQCGEAMARGNAHEYPHDLQSGAALNLRIFAEDTDPHRCGVIEVEISEHGIYVGWFGDDVVPVDSGALAVESRRPRWSWNDLIDVLREALMPEGKFTLVSGEDDA